MESTITYICAKCCNRKDVEKDAGVKCINDECQFRICKQCNGKWTMLHPKYNWEKHQFILSELCDQWEITVKPNGRPTNTFLKMYSNGSTG